MKTLLAIFLFVISATAQRPDLAEYTPVGSTTASTYFVSDEIGQKGAKIIFALVITKIPEGETETNVLDDQNYILSFIIADCKLSTYEIQGTKGVIGGKEYKEGAVKERPARAKSAIGKILSGACSMKLGPEAE